jgi:hypothetical protein
MKSIVIICPYFGKLPTAQMKIWLNSCLFNPTINWLIITDDKENGLQFPTNVDVMYMSFVELKSLIKSRMPFKVEFNSPYKLCDYKPAYGYIFKDYISKYDFWGHNDMTDTVIGDLRKFITEERLNKYDKLGVLGHLTLYRNTDKVNNRIFEKASSNITFEQVASNDDYMGFDEIADYSINAIYRHHKYPYYQFDSEYNDIPAQIFHFTQGCINEDFNYYRPKITPRIYEWYEGKLYCVTINSNNITKSELAYVHYQKRKMISEVTNYNHFYIVPNRFINATETITIDLIKRYSKRKIFYMKALQIKRNNLRCKIKRILKK